MKMSLVRRFVATAALIAATLSAQAQAATLSFEAFYDPDTGNMSISPFDNDTNTPWVGDAELALVDLNSTSGVFTGSAPNFPGGAFTTNTDFRVSWALLGSSITTNVVAPYNMGNIAQTGLTQAFIDTDFTSGSNGSGVLGQFTWGTTGGVTGTGPVTSTAPVPEPSTIASFGLGAVAILGYAGRRRLRRGMRKKIG